MGVVNMAPLVVDSLGLSSLNRNFRQSQHDNRSTIALIQVVVHAFTSPCLHGVNLHYNSKYRRRVAVAQRLPCDISLQICSRSTNEFALALTPLPVCLSSIFIDDYMSGFEGG